MQVFSYQAFRILLLFLNIGREFDVAHAHCEIGWRMLLASLYWKAKHHSHMPFHHKTSMTDNTLFPCAKANSPNSAKVRSHEVVSGLVRG